MKKCLYCKSPVVDDSVIDFCERCGKRVFGDKMFNLIVQNMKDAQELGDMDQSECVA